MNEESGNQSGGKKRYLWRNHPWIRYLWRSLFENKRFSLETLSLVKASFKSGIPSQHQNKGTASRDSGHDAPLSMLWGTGGAARAAMPADSLSASEYAYRQVCSPPRVRLIADADRMPVVVPAMRSHLFQRSSAVNLSVTGDIEMVSYVREPPVADVVPAASLKIQPPPLRVAEQWIIIKVMVLMSIRCRRSVRARRQGRWLR